VPATLEVREQELRDRLIRADFKERFLGDDQPPAMHYELGEEVGAFYAEFLTPLIGSEYDRKGNRQATAQVGGITSQKLRYVELLLDSPLTIELSRANGFPFEKPALRRNLNNSSINGGFRGGDFSVRSGG